MMMEIASFIFFLAISGVLILILKQCVFAPQQLLTQSGKRLLSRGDFENVHCGFNELLCLLRPLELLLPKKYFTI